MEEIMISEKNPFEELKLKEKKKFNFFNMNSLYLFNNNIKFKEAISFDHAINFPDGSLISRTLKIKKFRGPDFTEKFLKSKEAKNKKHFFIGLKKEEIGKLSKITGINKENIFSYSPSFVEEEFSKKERDLMIKKINKSKANYLWVCVGNPKQEILSYQLFYEVNVNKIFNVGAALDFLLEKKKKSPKLINNLGMEWVYLGITNPKRTLKKIKKSFIALRYLRSLKK
jgi:N-acetylglucosaminyldiphosphoundecaprenol N-acetyl-beta-D-mannosaminyltransferase